MDWKETIKNNFSSITKKYDYFGVRSLCNDEKYQIGDITRNSFDWDFENDKSSDVELDGTCAIYVDGMWIEDANDLILRIEKVLPEMKQYNGGQDIALLGSNSCNCGYDDNETIMRNAEVIAIIK